jgi:hypothetical protein
MLQTISLPDAEIRVLVAVSFDPQRGKLHRNKQLTFFSSSSSPSTEYIGAVNAQIISDGWLPAFLLTVDDCSLYDQ